jgi:FMN phosphatase YigB (HAD superfamily)
MNGSVRVVLTDLDDTLFDHRRATRTALTYLRACDQALARWEIDELDRRHGHLLEAGHIEVLAGRLSIDAARVNRFWLLLIDAAADRPAERAAEVARTYRVAYERAWHPVSGAVELVKAIKGAGPLVVVVTNNVAAEQRQKLDRCGLTPHVDALITSE